MALHVQHRLKGLLIIEVLDLFVQPVSQRAEGVDKQGFGFLAERAGGGVTSPECGGQGVQGGGESLSPLACLVYFLFQRDGVGQLRHRRGEFEQGLAESFNLPVERSLGAAGLAEGL